MLRLLTLLRLHVMHQKHLTNTHFSSRFSYLFASLHHPDFPHGSLPLLPPCAHLPKSSPSIFASFCLHPPYCRLRGADTALLKSHTTEREGKNAQMVNQWGVSEPSNDTKQNLAFIIPTGWLACRLWHLRCAKSFPLACSSHAEGIQNATVMRTGGAALVALAPPDGEPVCSGACNYRRRW